MQVLCMFCLNKEEYIYNFIFFSNLNSNFEDIKSIYHRRSMFVRIIELIIGKIIHNIVNWL